MTKPGNGTGKNTGVGSSRKSPKRGRRSHEPDRHTLAWPAFNKIGDRKRITAPKPTPKNLRNFANTPIARRAINAIKNPISMAEWEIVPINESVRMNSELARQLEVDTYCFSHPNNDDSFRLLLEQVIEEYLVPGAGCIEMQLSGDPVRPLWMYPVDGSSIKINPGWDGSDPYEARYAQSLQSSIYSGSTGTDILLRNDELVYIRANPNAWNPFGKSPLEVSFQDIARFLSTVDSVGQIASNLRPNILIDLGDIGPEEVESFRTYWRNDIEGQGQIPIAGFPGAPGDPKGRGIGVHRLWPDGDNAMFLKYQELLIRFVANGFDLSPQNLGIERDVNRDTSEAASDRDWNTAILPLASLIAEHLTREVLHLKLAHHSLAFRFKGMTRVDEQADAETYERNYKSNLLTPNEQRVRRGMKPLNNPFADMLAADVEIAIQAARGAAVVDDPNLPQGGRKPSKGSENGKRKPEGDKGREPIPSSGRQRRQPNGDVESADE